MLFLQQVGRGVTYHLYPCVQVFFCLVDSGLSLDASEGGGER